MHLSIVLSTLLLIASINLYEAKKCQRGADVNPCKEAFGLLQKGANPEQIRNALVQLLHDRGCYTDYKPSGTLPSPTTGFSNAYGDYGYGNGNDYYGGNGYSNNNNNDYYGQNSNQYGQNGYSSYGDSYNGNGYNGNGYNGNGYNGNGYSGNGYQSGSDQSYGDNYNTYGGNSDYYSGSNMGGNYYGSYGSDQSYGYQQNNGYGQNNGYDSSYGNNNNNNGYGQSNYGQSNYGQSYGYQDSYGNNYYAKNGATPGPGPDNGPAPGPGKMQMKEASVTEAPIAKRQAEEVLEAPVVPTQPMENQEFTPEEHQQIETWVDNFMLATGIGNTGVTRSGPGPNAVLEQCSSMDAPNLPAFLSAVQNLNPMQG